MASCLVGGRWYSARSSSGERKPRKKDASMQENKNRKGLALSAILALVASLFGVAPAAQSNENALVIYAEDAGAASANSMVHGEAFETVIRIGTGVSNPTSNFGISYVIDSASAAVKIERDDDGTYGAGDADITATSYSDTAANDGYATFTSASPYVRFSLYGLTSVSPAVSITVTPYMDKDGVGGLTSGDAAGDAYTINFVPWSAMGASIALTAPEQFGRGITTSFSVTEGTIRWSQLDGFFTVVLEKSGDGDATNSASINGSDVEQTGAQLRTLGYSFSAAIPTHAFTMSPPAQVSVSAQAFYVSSDPAANDNLAAGSAITGLTKVGVAPRTITGVTMSPVVSDNAKQTGANAADVRVNSAFTVNAYAHSTAETVSMAVQTIVSVSAVGSNVELDADSGIILGGVTHTSSATLLKASVTLSAGTTTVAVSTFGQDNDGSAETLDLIATSQAITSTAMRFSLAAPTYAVAYTPTAVAGAAGAAKTFDVTVKDQFAKLSARTDQRVAASVVVSGSTSETVSAAVASGVASVTVTPVPAARTGSGTVTLTLQTFNQDTQMWDNTATDTATWNLYGSADSFVSRTASVSASISYGVVYSWSGTVAIAVTNSASDVVVSAPGLIIQNADDTSETASDTLTITATDQAVNVKFVATKTGTHVVTFTNGTDTTTSEVVVSAAPSDMGASITWDTTQITPGKTKVIVGTVLDANGNPVDTTITGAQTFDSGTASILVTYYGDAGIIVGSMPTETDADGQFRLSVLTSAADRGTLTITATYLSDGSSTAAADKITSVNAVNVGPADVAADQKITVGTFKGYVAIYTKGYMGQKLSAKVAGKWLVVDPIAAYKSNDYSRTVRLTGAGYTITVDLYIDGAFVRSEVVTTK